MKYVWFIRLLIQIHKHSKILVILINDANQSSKLTACICKKKEERKRQRPQAKQTHNRLLSIVVFVRESYLFCASCIFKLWRVEINSSCVLLSVRTKSTSNFEYEQYEHDIKISMNNHIVWVWVEFTHCFEYSLLISDTYIHNWSLLLTSPCCEY